LSSWSSPSCIVNRELELSKAKKVQKIKNLFDHPGHLILGSPQKNVLPLLTSFHLRVGQCWAHRKSHAVATITIKKSQTQARRLRSISSSFVRQDIHINMDHDIHSSSTNSNDQITPSSGGGGGGGTRSVDP